jgi:hypothetical protein
MMVEREKPVSGWCAYLYPITETPTNEQGARNKRARYPGCGVTMEEPDPNTPAFLRISEG